MSKDKPETKTIFGDFIDKYLLQDAELDGATVPILYDGRTADGVVQDAQSLDQLFDDMFRTYTDEELSIIKAKYGTAGDILEAPKLIGKKAQDMLVHYVDVVLSAGKIYLIWGKTIGLRLCPSRTSPCNLTGNGSTSGRKIACR
jgi:type I restriction enzyme R subunit